MSQQQAAAAGRRPLMAAQPYHQPAGQYMPPGQQMPPMGPGPGAPPPQRFMMGGQMGGTMYHQPGQMYMMPSQQQHPGPPVSPANRTTPQLQNMVTNSPKQPSPALSVSSDHGSTHSNKPGDEMMDVKMECEDPSSVGHPRAAPSPAGSTGSRSNTPASIPGGQAGSPMPVRPPSGPLDGTNRMTQSPMAASSGYNQQMMPPPNSMGFITGPGKMGGPGQMPGHYPQYNSQYPPQGIVPGGSYTRQQQPGMGGMSGPPMQGNPMQNYPSSQPAMYPNGGQMPPAPMYNNMMNRGMGQPGYGGGYPQPPQMNPQYSYMGGPMAPGQHSGMPPQGVSSSGPMMPTMSSQQGMMGGQQSNKAAQAAQAAMMAAANSTGGPRMSRGAMSPSRGMFQGGAGSPLAQMNNMTNSANFGSPSLNSMSNAVEQLGRGGLAAGAPPTSAPSPIPNKSSHYMPGLPPHSSGTGTNDMGQNSPLSSNTEAQDSSSRPNSAVHPPELSHTSDTTGSDSSSGGMPSDSTSVDSGFHSSSDQSDKTSDSVSTPTVPSPPHNNGGGGGPANGESVSPPSSQDQQHKMPFSEPASLSSMGSLPSSTGVTTAASGPMTTSVTQSIASPVTSVNPSMSPHPHHPQHMGVPHHHPMMGGAPPPHHMMQNGMPHGMMNAGGGPPMGHMMGPSMSQNGPIMAPGVQPGPMMGHNGPLMPPNMNNGSMMPGMPPHHHMQQQPQQGQMNCMPMPGNNNNALPDEQPEKKRKTKKSSSDLSKLFELGPEPDRRPFLERVLSFLEEAGQPVTALPVISKTPLDLYKLYFSVREKGGFEEVTRNKKWREVCTVVNIGTSASAAFTLKKNYIRYLFSYECKFDRGGINPAPILAQMEAQTASKREQKSKRAPSPGSNSNDAFRPPSVPNNQMDSSYPPANMPPPPYMQNPDGNMANPLMSGGNMMMAPNNMMGGAPMGGMMGGPAPHPPMMAGPAPPNMMGQQQGMMHPSSGPAGNMMGGPPQMMPGGPPGYGGPPPHMMQQQQAMPPASVPGPMINSDSISVQDPFSDEAYQRGGGSTGSQPTPPPPSANTDSNSSSSSVVTSQAGPVSVPPPTSSSGVYPGGDPQAAGFPPRTGEAPFSQQMDNRPDRMAMRPSGPPSQQQGEMYQQARFPGGPMMRPAGDGQYYQSQQYPGYQGFAPRPAGPMYTPNKRFPDDHGPDNMGPQWSPVGRSRVGQNPPGGYMPPGPPSTPPMGPFSRQLGHRNSPQSREAGSRYTASQKKALMGGLLAPAPPMTKKELIFPQDCVEGVGISTTKRKKLTSKDLAPFEAWRLMLSLKSGLLAESTWALDTMNVLLYDDSTYGYFSLATLPGLLEVLTEHFRHCLINMFEDFGELERGQSRKPVRGTRLRRKSSVADSSLATAVEEAAHNGKCVINEHANEDGGSVFQILGPNFTKVSRKGLPVKFDPNPADDTVLQSKAWDLYTGFKTKSDHWLVGCGDITDHIITHLESGDTHKFLARKFRRKRRIDDLVEEEVKDPLQSRKVCKSEQCTSVKSSCDDCLIKKEADSEPVEKSSQCPTDVKHSLSSSSDEVSKSVSVREASSVVPAKDSTNSKNNLTVNHSSVCNGGLPEIHIKSEPMDPWDENQESKAEINGDLKEEICDSESSVQENCAKETKDSEKKEEESSCSKEVSKDSSKPVVENGDLEEPKLSPMVNHCYKEEQQTKDCGDSSPPVLRAEGLVEEEGPLNSTMEPGSEGTSMECQDTSLVVDTTVQEEKKPNLRECATVLLETEKKKEAEDPSDIHNNEEEMDPVVNASVVSETEELSATIVTSMLKEDENTEEEAFQRDDPPLCVTSESRDELGRRCVCISNILRSLSNVPGNEVTIGKHPGIMRVLGHLLLLHHSHPVRPQPRRLQNQEGHVEEEEQEEAPRVYDDEHWWWDYLDQLRENALVILANICGHLHLSAFSQEVCFPLLEGLLHWVMCPASVARDPLPTLGPGAVLSPQKLVLEALCKLCIHEPNVDLLLATPPVKHLLELYSVLVQLLADRNHPITREFSIVLLSYMVPGDSSVARAVALQHQCVSLLVDFLESAESNALNIANQQGIELLQSNPEMMGTSLDMLRRASNILLHLARVPDNRRLFVQQQPRLLNLVMSEILDQTVSKALSEVLFECSQGTTTV